ncbi:Suppressor of SWI4 1 [Blattella germanica]|nr:Suppressor of SWI4 1 [Blattella germanica]
MGKKRKRSKSKKNIQANKDEPEELKQAPHSFVFHRGSVGSNIVELTKDFRKVMEPFTASSLKARKKNAIKDFVSVAGLLHVTHICIFTSTELGCYLKIARLPHGPTLTFWIQNFSLGRDVISMNKKQYVFDKLYKNSPLIVLNSFSGEGLHMKLMSSMFQNMFPTINIRKVNLSDVRRCVLLNYNPDTKYIDFRHYAIKAIPVGLSKGVKKIVQSKVPNLGRLQDISEYITKSGQLSESEAEDDETSHVTLPQKLASRGNMASAQSALRLFEIGPRLTLQLMKIEEGLMNGEVLFHEIIERTEEEKILLKKRRDEKRKLKEKRKRIQEENVKQKIKKKEELKQKSLKGMRKSENELEMQKALLESETNENENDDDAEWYRKEVGEEPDKDLFDHMPKKRKQLMGGPPSKKKKVTFKDSEAKTNSFPRIQNKFAKSKLKTHRSNQNPQFKKRKVFGSKISKKSRS